MTEQQQLEALHLAGMNEAAAHGYPAATVGYQLHTDTAAELRRLHAENESMRTAIKKLHSSRGRYHTQLAACDLYDHSEQSYMGCVTSDMHELAEWLNTMYEDSKEQITALEQPQVVRETAPNGATHIQPQQGAFYKRVDEKWYVWSRMEDGCPHRWYISPGTVESCLKPISATTERLQNHVPDAGDMVPAGWKLVPVEPTVEMMDAGGAATRRCYQHLNKGEVMCSYVYRNMLAAAPQPPIPSNPRQQQQSQGEQEPVAWISPSALEWSTRESEKVVKLTRKAQPEYDFTEPLYTHPQPAQKPLTDEQVLKAVRHLYQSDLPIGMGFSDDLDVARAIEAAHNIK